VLSTARASGYAYVPVLFAQGDHEVNHRAMNVRPGIVLDNRYRIDEGPLSRDGFGETWRATDTVLSRPVTITVLRADLATDDSIVRWWHAESRKAAARPPAPDESLQVCDFGQTQSAAEDNIVYQVALRIGPGRDLSDRQNQRPRTDNPHGPNRPSTWEDDLRCRVNEITDPNETLQQARRYIQQAHDTADSGASERDALVLMTTAAETYEALDTFIRTQGRLPTEWIRGAE
jgi:hypothetical protein